MLYRRILVEDFCMKKKKKKTILCIRSRSRIEVNKCYTIDFQIYASFWCKYSFRNVFFLYSIQKEYAQAQLKNNCLAMLDGFGSKLPIFCHFFFLQIELGDHCKFKCQIKVNRVCINIKWKWIQHRAWIVYYYKKKKMVFWCFFFDLCNFFPSNNPLLLIS